ncbi:hypothetical protein CHS0354_031533 [Potamilus streckersoni]|uniref:BPTI/Kunitz inhibitor domain-containing protein n=1 Tax=Potamilus streckersoni TaxID=2493646 RepID=A0AAE0VWQ0_9BIVA|nr:hypothetical protein CHS0354_031533 [Potamilus streckersoni]
MNMLGCVPLIICLQICVWLSDGADLCSDKCEKTHICVRHPRERRMVCILKRCMKIRSRGFCRKFTFRYYFDPLSFECIRFAYGGCYGSRNNFMSKESCESRCTPPPLETNVFTAINLTTTTTATTSLTTTMTTARTAPTISTNTWITTTTSTNTTTNTPAPLPTTTTTPITTIITNVSTPPTTTTHTTIPITTIIPATTTTTTAVSCGIPPSISGLKLLNFTNGTLPGDVRYYICQNESLTFDYTFTANSECSSIKCQNDGHWTKFNGTCSEPFLGLSTNADGSIAGSWGRITSPNRPLVYVPPNHAVYRYSIITTGRSITFTFNGAFGIDSMSFLVIFCGFDVPIDQQDVIYRNTSTNPGNFTCLSGCATIAFQVSDLGLGSRLGFDITWQALNNNFILSIVKYS